MSATKDYAQGEWREDLRRVMLRGGRDGVPVVFIVSDTLLQQGGGGGAASARDGVGEKQEGSRHTLLEDAQRVLDYAEVPGESRSRHHQLTAESIRTCTWPRGCTRVVDVNLTGADA